MSEIVKYGDVISLSTLINVNQKSTMGTIVVEAKSPHPILAFPPIEGETKTSFREGKFKIAGPAGEKDGQLLSFGDPFFLQSEDSKLSWNNKTPGHNDNIGIQASGQKGEMVLTFVKKGYFATPVHEGDAEISLNVVSSNRKRKTHDKTLTVYLKPKYGVIGGYVSSVGRGDSLLLTVNIESLPKEGKESNTSDTTSPIDDETRKESQTILPDVTENGENDKRRLSSKTGLIEVKEKPTNEIGKEVDLASTQIEVDTGSLNGVDTNIEVSNGDDVKDSPILPDLKPSDVTESNNTVKELAEMALNEATTDNGTNLPIIEREMSGNLNKAVLTEQIPTNEEPEENNAVEYTISDKSNNSLADQNDVPSLETILPEAPTNEPWVLVEPENSAQKVPAVNEDAKEKLLIVSESSTAKKEYPSTYAGDEANPSAITEDTDEAPKTCCIIL